jgi:hypothetical protein
MIFTGVMWGITALCMVLVLWLVTRAEEENNRGMEKVPLVMPDSQNIEPKTGLPYPPPPKRPSELAEEYWPRPVDAETDESRKLPILHDEQGNRTPQRRIYEMEGRRGQTIRITVEEILE